MSTITGHVWDLRYESNTDNNCSSAVAITVLASEPNQTPEEPDLVVVSPTVSPNTLVPGQFFTLSATIQNQGTSESRATTLGWYRSPNANISVNDIEVGTTSVDSLSARRGETKQIRLKAPIAADIYYYGGCVESIRYESNTDNNCSMGIAITVQNLAPVAVDTLPNQTLSVGDLSVTVDVSPYFSDPNDDVLTYKAWTSDTGIVEVEMSGLSDSYLRINPLAEGSATVAVQAKDPNGLTFRQDFSVTVNANPNQPPVAIGVIPDQTLAENGAVGTVDVAQYFKDPDNTPLIYTATSDNPTVATVGVVGSRVTITLRSAGGATVTVIASDGELTATQTISVTATQTVTPDLVVESISVSDDTLDPGESFTLSATVRNKGTGDARPTRLRYYGDNGEVGTSNVRRLSPNQTREVSISLETPDETGTYYYDACVSKVRD